MGMWQRVLLLVGAIFMTFSGEVKAQGGPATITNVAPYGVGPVTISSTSSGYNADIGNWPEVANFGCNFIHVDVDVRDGGTLTGTYSVRQSPNSDSYIDIYFLEPGVTWDPGTTWNQSGTERCFRRDFPPGVVAIDGPTDAWGYPNWETPDFPLSIPLDAYVHQSVRVVFRQWSWGAVYDEHIQSRVRDLSVGALPALTVSPSSLDLSTGDTNRFITTMASPVTTQFTPTFAQGSQSNPNSSCAVSLNFSANGGTGTVNTSRASITVRVMAQLTAPIRN
jgi:hypothetical protein